MLSGYAQAQSNVTVYGIVDVGYVGAKSTLSSVSGNQLVKTTYNYSVFSENQESNTRLGVKGGEDLGGGTSAFFTVEMGLTPQEAGLSGGTAYDSLQQTTQNSGSAIINRQSFAGLKKDGIGQFALGRQYTPIFNASAVSDPSQLANVAGNVIYNLPALGDAQGAGSGGGNAFTNRASNALTAKTDSVGGFSAAGMYALNINNATQVSSTGGTSNWNGWGLSADFTWQKLYLTAAYQSFKTQTAVAQISSNTLININGAGPTSGQMMVGGGIVIPAVLLADKQTYAAAVYDFGVLKAYIQWIGRNIQNSTGTNGAIGATLSAGSQLNRSAQQIGLRGNVTPAIEGWATIGNGKYTGPVTNGITPGSIRDVGWQAGANYYFIKRTNLYAIYCQSQTSANSVTAGSGNSSQQYTVGMRHTF